VFEQIAGDKPTGSTLYYIDCDKAAPLGQPVCLPANNGKVTLTYCAAGKQTCVYRISSMGRVRMHADSTGTVGEPLKFNIAGLIPSTIKWTSVYPGKTGAYDGYLQAQSNGGSVTMMPDENCPEKMKFEVSGTHKNACGDAVAYVDTIDLTLYSHLAASTTPNNAVCADGGTVVLNTQALGGKAPYNFTWKDEKGKVIGNTAECSVHTPGNYTVQITDAKHSAVTQTVGVLTAKVSLPANVRVDDIKQENASVAWEPMPQASRFAVRCRATGTTNWTYRKADGTVAEAKLKDLQPGQTYELQLMAYGTANDSSGWSATQTFSTEGPCMNANNLRYKIRSGDAWFYWTQNPYCTKQELVLKKKGAADWERKYKLGSKVNSVVVDHLKGGVDYEWAIKSYCPSGNYNGVKEFTLSDVAAVSLNGSTGDMASADANANPQQR